MYCELRLANEYVARRLLEGELSSSTGTIKLALRKNRLKVASIRIKSSSCHSPHRAPAPDAPRPRDPLRAQTARAAGEKHGQDEAHVSTSAGVAIVLLVKSQK